MTDMSKIVNALLILLVALPFAARADDGNKDLPARVEITPIQSLTLTDSQFLTGDANARPVTIAGEFRAAQGVGARPVVILIHGSGGVGGSIDAWARILNAIGISTFAIDGFTGRGIVQTATDQSRLGRLNLILDAYRALAIVAKNPRVDPSRIALMGFSRGGEATLFAGVERFNHLWNRSGVTFAAYLPFYPNCATTFEQDSVFTGGPIHIFAGTADDYNPPARCEPLIARVSAAGHPIAITLYQGASHTFDNPLGANPAVVAKGAETARHCDIVEGPTGTLVDAATQQAFTYTAACVEHDPHLGADPVATAAARTEVAAILRTVFELP